MSGWDRIVDDKVRDGGFVQSQVSDFGSFGIPPVGFELASAVDFFLVDPIEFSAEDFAATVVGKLFHLAGFAIDGIEVLAADESDVALGGAQLVELFVDVGRFGQSDRLVGGQIVEVEIFFVLHEGLFEPVVEELDLSAVWGRRPVGKLGQTAECFDEFQRGFPGVHGPGGRIDMDPAVVFSDEIAFSVRHPLGQWARGCGIGDFGGGLKEFLHGERFALDVGGFEVHPSQGREWALLFEGGERIASADRIERAGFELRVEEPPHGKGLFGVGFEQVGCQFAEAMVGRYDPSWSERFLVRFERNFVFGHFPELELGEILARGDAVALRAALGVSGDFDHRDPVESDPACEPGAFLGDVVAGRCVDSEGSDSIDRELDVVFGGLHFLDAPAVFGGREVRFGSWGFGGWIIGS